MYSIFSCLTNARYLYIFIMYSGADVSAVDKDGNSPLHVAQQARPLADQVGHSVISFSGTITQRPKHIQLKLIRCCFI